MKRNYTYMVKCSDGTLYTGWTTDLEHRVKAHNDGEGAKYTRSRRPVELEQDSIMLWAISDSCFTHTAKV